MEKEKRKLSRCRSGKSSKIQEVKKQSTEQYVLYALLSVVKEKSAETICICVCLYQHKETLKGNMRNQSRLGRVG